MQLSATGFFRVMVKLRPCMVMVIVCCTSVQPHPILVDRSSSLPSAAYIQTGIILGTQHGFAMHPRRTTWSLAWHNCRQRALASACTLRASGDPKSLRICSGDVSGIPFLVRFLSRNARTQLYKTIVNPVEAALSVHVLACAYSHSFFPVCFFACAYFLWACANVSAPPHRLGRCVEYDKLAAGCLQVKCVQCMCQQ